MQADDDARFWIAVSEQSLAAVWDSADDDIYAKLLEERAVDASAPSEAQKLSVAEGHSATG